MLAKERIVGILLILGPAAYLVAVPASEDPRGLEPAARGAAEAKPADAPADLAIVNARVWTGVDAVQTKPGDVAEPSALAVVGDKIVAVGDDATVRGRIGPATKVIDAHGRRVIPGITDSHTHIVSGGFQLARLTLRDVRSREEFVRAVAAQAKAKKKGRWVLGGRWSVESWDKQEPPNRAWLDPVTGAVPVFLTRMDGHQALVNSAALRLAGIDASGPDDPSGGEIERDPKTGEPTGILKESAMGLVSRLIPDPTPTERYQALRRAMRHANSLGVTSVHDMCSLADLEAFRQAEGDGAMTVRITAYLSVSDWASYVDKLPSYGLNSDTVRLAGFKGFMDGSLGSRTAYMREEYSDATPDTRYPRGYLVAAVGSPESFQERVAMVDARGRQLAVHAIGDEAIHLLLNAYQAAGSRLQAAARGLKPEAGYQGHIHRVEHSQHLHVSDIPRFAKLGVVASMQPFHKADDGRYAEKALGKKRLAGSYAFRQLVDAGALVIFGSDWPVVTMNPFAGIDAAVNARTLAGVVWLPSHSLTLEEALRAYTVLPPRAVHQGDRLGTIETGKLADIVILADDPLAIASQRLGKVKVAQTIVGGKVVYNRAG